MEKEIDFNYVSKEVLTILYYLNEELIKKIPDNIIQELMMSAADCNEEIVIDSLLERTLEDLKKAKVIDDHKLEHYHSICVSPAYVHISKDGKAETERIISHMEDNNVYMVGRYARWEYSAMDDSIEQSKALSSII